MPIDSLSPNTLGRYYQAIQPTPVIFRAEVSCTADIRFCAMPTTSLDAYMSGRQCTVFNDSTIPTTSDMVIEFVVMPNTPWVIVVVNRHDMHIAVYWRAFLRR